VPDNKQVIERFERAFAANDAATIAGYTQAFPDLEFADGPHVIVEGDTAATRWTAAGTHEGEMMGIPATGKRIRVEGMNFYRLANGRITDVWTQFDGISMLQQLGVMPAPATAGGAR